MAQKDRKGAPKASAIMKSSKAGFDTYQPTDKEKLVMKDSVTLVKRGSSYDTYAKDSSREEEKANVGKGYSKDLKNIFKKVAAIAAVDSQARLSKDSPAMREHYKRNYPADRDHKFFKHTQKDNK